MLPILNALDMQSIRMATLYSDFVQKIQVGVFSLQISVISFVEERSTTSLLLKISNENRNMRTEFGFKGWVFAVSLWEDMHLEKKTCYFTLFFYFKQVHSFTFSCIVG